MDDLRRALKTHGAKRARARETAKAESQTIAGLARQALDEGIAKAEICKLAQISRPALDTMLKD